MENLGWVAIGLSNPKSPSNVGAVMRAAGCYGASAIYYTGTRFERAAKYHQDTKNMNRQIALKALDQFSQIERTCQRVCVELVEGAIALPEFEHPENALYIFGPEDGSIDQPEIDDADAVVYIPTEGCMNLAATVNVVLYDRLAKQRRRYNELELIRHSRDVNNRLVIKG